MVVKIGLDSSSSSGVDVGTDGHGPHVGMNLGKSDVSGPVALYLQVSLALALQVVRSTHLRSH